jgi:hypothetical protein
MEMAGRPDFEGPQDCWKAMTFSYKFFFITAFIVAFILAVN